MHAWAYSANQNIKKNNRKAELEGREPEVEKIFSDAPVGSITNAPLELPVMKKYHDHAFLRVNLRASEDNSGDESEKEEDGKFSSVVSSLKKRKQQRKEQKEMDSKKKTAVEGGGEARKFELQAAASNRQITATESKNMIEFLHLAQDSTVWSQNEMQEMFVSAKRSIFGKEKENEPTPSPTEPVLVVETLPTDTVDTGVDSDGDDIYN